MRFTLGLLFCSFIIGQSKEDHIFQYLTSQKDKLETEYFIVELNRYINTFPASGNSPMARFNLAQAYFSEEEYDLSLTHYIFLAKIFPTYKKEETQQQIQRILHQLEEKKYRPYLESIQKNLLVSGTGKLIDDLFSYMKLLYHVQTSEFNQQLISTADIFFKLYPESLNGDIVRFYIAAAYQAEEKFEQALFHYDLINTCYLTSNERPFALEQMSKIYSEELSKYGDAIKIHRKTIELYPKSQNGINAWYSIALIQETELDKISEAIDSYKKYLDRIKTNEKKVKTLTKIAKLFENKGQYGDAVSSLRKIIELDSIKIKSAKVQEKIISITEDDLRNNELTAKEMFAFYSLFPRNPEAPRYLYEASQLYFEKLENKAKAIELLDIIIKEYKKSDSFEDAQDFLEEIKTGTN